MIQINLSDMAYTNDVYPLVKAFYPEEEIQVIDGAASTTEDNRTRDGAFASDIDYYLNIYLLQKGIDIEFTYHTVPEVWKEKKLSQTLKPGIMSKTGYKNTLKRLLYRILSDAAGKDLPWGILTGIRPTKLVYEMLEHGDSDSRIRARMKEEYLCSDSKIAMSIGIAKREMKLLEDIDYRNGYSLYIGIPFCPSTCLYCSFTSYSIEKFKSYVELYLKALEKEVIYGATCFPGRKLTTVYLGGGTPTTLSADQLDRLLGMVREHYDFTHVREFCVEAGRPDSITADKLRVLKQWGVDRISINPQSMQQKTLDLIGRRHTVEQIKEAFRLARQTGHDNINMDMIIGLPGESLEDITDTLAQIGKLKPDSLTVHTLAIKRAARLSQKKEEYADRKASDVRRMQQATIEFAERNGYLPYYLYRQKNMADNLENIGYAKHGKEGLYNILIMEEQQTILALGAGALSKFVFHEENRIERISNVKSVTDYIGRIDEMIGRKRGFLEDNGLGV